MAQPTNGLPGGDLQPPAQLTGISTSGPSLGIPLGTYQQQQQHHQPQQQLQHQQQQQIPAPISITTATATATTATVNTSNPPPPTGLKTPGPSTSAVSTPGSAMGTPGTAAVTPNPFAHNLSRTSPATVVWLHDNYEACEGVSLGRSTLYQHYRDHCKSLGQDPVNQASFGKLIRSVFPNLKTRRLGTRGNSKYHYYGIRLKPESTLHFSPDQIGGAHHRYRARTSTEKTKTKKKEETDDSEQQEVVLLERHIRVDKTLPEFPTMAEAGLVDQQQDFSKPYHAHSKDVLKMILTGQFADVQAAWQQFWGAPAAHFKKTLNSPDGMKYVDSCDKLFWDTIEVALLVDPLAPMPESLTKEIRYFAKCMEPWTRSAMEGYPEGLLQVKLKHVQGLAHRIRRYTSLNHLAHAASAVVADAEQTRQMFSDIKCVDFKAVHAQGKFVCQCPYSKLLEIAAEFKESLNKQYSIERIAQWLQDIMKGQIDSRSRDQTPLDAAQVLLTKWSFYSSIVIRDLTLRSVKGFGSFHLLRLLYDEYLMYMVEEIRVSGTDVLSVPPGANRIVLPSGGAHSTPMKMEATK